MRQNRILAFFQSSMMPTTSIGNRRGLTIAANGAIKFGRPHCQQCATDRRAWDRFC